MKRRIRVLNSWWHRWQIKRRARRDGRLGIPTEGEKGPTPYESILIAQAQQAAEYVEKGHVEEINRLQRSLAGAIERMGRHTGQFKSKFDEYRGRKHKLGRGVTIHVSSYWYLLVMTLIMISELALNFQAFQVFQKPLLLTFLMALTVGVALPGSAHFIGILVKQWQKPAWRTAIYVALAFTVGIGAIIGINAARSEYLQLLDAELRPEEDSLQYAFMLINLLLFLTAILTSYFAHDADPEIEKLRKEFRDLDRQCHRTNEEINAADARLATARAQNELDQRNIEAILKELLQLYRAENRAARKDGMLPEAFKVATDGLLTKRVEPPREGPTQQQILEVRGRWFELDKHVKDQEQV